MLLKAEKIISHGDTLLDKSTDEIFSIARRELAGKITDEMISKGLVKIETTSEIHDDFGTILKVRASVRAYNPDD